MHESEPDDDSGPPSEVGGSGEYTYEKNYCVANRRRAPVLTDTDCALLFPGLDEEDYPENLTFIQSNFFPHFASCHSICVQPPHAGSGADGYWLPLFHYVITSHQPAVILSTSEARVDTLFTELTQLVSSLREPASSIRVILQHDSHPHASTALDARSIYITTVHSHHQLHIDYNLQKFTIFDMEEITAEVSNAVFALANFYPQCAIHVFADRVTPELHTLKGIMAETDSPPFIFAGGHTAPVLLSSAQHFPQRFDGRTSFAQDLLHDVISSSFAGTVGVFCEDDSGVRAVRDLLASKCRSCHCLLSSISLLDVRAMAERLSDQSDSIVVINDSHAQTKQRLLEEITSCSRVVHMSFPWSPEVLARRLWTMRDAGLAFPKLPGSGFSYYLIGPDTMRAQRDHIMAIHRFLTSSGQKLKPAWVTIVDSIK